MSTSSILLQTSYPLAQWHVPASDLLYKPRIGKVQHDVKMLDSMDAFQARPVLEPDDFISRDSLAESFIDKVVDLLPRYICEVTSPAVFGESEFGPDDEVYDVFGNAVGPVVAENQVVGFGRFQVRKG